MGKIGFCLLLAIAMFSCNSKDNAPDISGVKVNLEVQRFDNDFFSMDTNQLEPSLARLQEKYPEFLRLFMNNIAGIGEPDQIRSFYASYHPVYDSAQLLYHNFEPVRAGLEQAF